jgi:chromosome segregation protein
MRITRLDLERYGHFADKALLFRPDAPLHVVLGANEGGKTTALTAIADLLFGISPSTNYNFKHDNKALRIGAELLLKDGQRLNFRRRKGNQNTLLDANDQPLPEDFLARVIGTVSRDIFNKEFGLTAASLRQGGAELLKAGGKLAETLATGSAGLSALSALRETIAGEADGLFTARRSSSKEFYTALSRYEEADKKLKAAIVTAEAMHDAEAQFKAATASKKTIESEHQNLSGQLRRLERTARTRKTIVQIDKLSAEFQALSGLPEVAQIAAQSWRKALVEYQGAVADLAKLEIQDTDDLGIITSFAVDETLLASGGKIDQLRERLGAIKQSREDLPKRQTELAAAKSNLENIARRLGLSDLNVLLEQRPSDLALTRAEELANARAAADIRLAEAEDILAKTGADLRTLDQFGQNAEHPVDPALFRQRLQAVSHVPTSADRLKRETNNCDGDECDQLTAAKALAPQIGSLAELSSLQVPSLADIERFKQNLLELQNSRAKTQAAVTASQQKLTSVAAKIERLKRDGTQVTHIDLLDIRERRDVALNHLNMALDEALMTRRNAFDNLVSMSNQTDVLTDKLLRDSERATQLQTHKDEYADAELALAAAKREDNQLVETFAQLDASWKALWMASQVAPTSPAEMINWRQKFDVIVDAAKKIKGRRDDFVTLRQELEEAATAIAALMADYGRSRHHTLAAQILYGEASVWLEALQENWTKFREGSAKRDAAARAVEQSKADKVKRAQTVETVTSHWGETVAAIGLPIGASALEVRTAVGLWKDRWVDQ